MEGGKGPEKKKKSVEQGRGKVETPEEKEGEDESLTVDEKIPAIERELTEKYGEKAFKKAIIDEIKEFFPRDTHGNLQKNGEGQIIVPIWAQTIADSAWENRGKANFDKEMAELRENMDKIEKNLDHERRRVRERAERRLVKHRISTETDLAKAQTDFIEQAEEKAKEHKEAHDAEQQLIRILNASPPTLSEAQEKFHTYIDELGGRYFDSEWLPEDKKIYYKRRAKEFQESRHQDIERDLGYYYATKEITLENLKKVKLKIENKYHDYAKQDEDLSTISLRDFELKKTDTDEFVEKHAAEILDLAQMDDKESMEKLEDAFQDQPEVWAETVDNLFAYVIRQAEKDGNQPKIKDLAKEIKKERGETSEKTDTYELSKKYLYRKVREDSEKDVEKTMKLIMRISSEMNKEVNEEVFKDADKHAMKVYRQLMNPKSKLMPEAKRDRVMVLFVRAYPQEKKRFLRTPHLRKQLFLAIRTAEEKYGDLYKERYSDDPEAGAELKALEMIAKEARILVENYDKHKHLQGRNFAKRLNNTDAAVGKIHVSKLMTRKISRRYRSALSRGGFNGRDLALSAIKVAAGATVLVNVVNSVASSDKEGALEKILDGAEKSVTNPTVLISIATAYGANILQNNPQYFNHLKYGEYGRRRNRVAHVLNDMVDKIGYASVRNFIHDRNEWKAMWDLNLKPHKIRRLVEKAKERNGAVPLITKKDIKEEGVVEDYVITGMEDGPRRSQARFMFYEALLAKDKQDRQDILELKGMTTGNDVI